MPQIKVSDCTYVYQPGTITAKTAVEHIDLCVEQGEMIAVIGKGGSGKSTLSLLLAGLYEPSSGLVSVMGETAPAGKVFRQVGLVFQYPEQQLFSATVYDEVAFGARNFGAAEEDIPAIVSSALAEVGLDPQTYKGRDPFALSGGQKRRLCLACLLAIDPAVVILDEPTAGLDPAGREWVKRLIKRLHERGKTVIWVSHDMTEVAETAERVIVLNAGHLIMDGTPEQVFADEDKLTEAGLALPAAAKLLRRLKAEGIDVAARSVTAEAAYEEILSVLGGQLHV